MTDVVKERVAAHWNRRAPSFDEDFGHSIRTAAERAAWDRGFDLVVAGRRGLDALDAGCGTGFLAFELAARGHHVTGVDFAPAMIAEAKRKATERSVAIRFEQADVEALPFVSDSFDLARLGARDAGAGERGVEEGAAASGQVSYVAAGTRVLY